MTYYTTVTYQRAYFFVTRDYITLKMHPTLECSGFGMVINKFFCGYITLVIWSVLIAAWVSK